MTIPGFPAIQWIQRKYEHYIKVNYSKAGWKANIVLRNCSLVEIY